MAISKSLSLGVAAASLILSLAVATPMAQAQSNAQSLSELLNVVRQEGREISAENKKREQEFLSKRNQQQALLTSAKASLAAEQRRSEQLKLRFDTNETLLTELQETLRIRLGDIGELFGVVRQSAGEAKGMIDASLLTVQNPDRGGVATDLGQAKKLPSIEELRELQYTLLEEMVGSGTVERFTTDYRAAGGEKINGEVVRVGMFNAVSKEGFLIYSEESNSLQVLEPQPAGRFTSPAKAFFAAAAGGTVAFPVDPSRGTLLSLETKKASPSERIQQGGPVGYVIIVIGLIGMAIASWRLLSLQGVSSKMARQLKSSTSSADNPLGRILSVYTDNPNIDTETLELKLDEAILRETPKLEKGQSIIKVFAAVAPLLGLLGTVVGMINTFQAITLFGTGDPKLMAGGISEALVTTMLGLIVAIPLVFMHTLVSGRSRGLVEVLEEQSAGVIARRSEQSNG